MEGERGLKVIIKLHILTVVFFFFFFFLLCLILWLSGKEGNPYKKKFLIIQLSPQQQSRVLVHYPIKRIQTMIHNLTSIYIEYLYIYIYIYQPYNINQIHVPTKVAPITAVRIPAPALSPLSKLNGLASVIGVP